MKVASDFILSSVTALLLTTNGENASIIQPTSSNDKKTKVIVVGAGFAGLSVAYHLQKDAPDQFDIQIVEARDRIGGRVYPWDLVGGAGSGDDDGSGITTVDLGGQWVHEASTKNPILGVMKELGLAFQTYDPDALQKRRFNIIYDSTTGTEIPKGVSKAASRIFYKALHNFEASEVTIDTSLEDLLTQQIELQSQSDGRVDTTSPDFLCAMNYLRHRTECYEGGRLVELNAALSDLYINKGGPDKLPAGGYGPLLDALRQQIGPERIRLNCAVESIAYAKKSSPSQQEPSTNDVSICIREADGDQILLGDYCVCTVPLGVLQQNRIQFIPDLPKSTQEAIHSIGMGFLDKIVLKFDHVFWGDLGQFGISDAKDPSLSKSFYDCSLDVGAPVLMTFVGGDAAQRIYDDYAPDGLDDDEGVVEDVMAKLRTVFGPQIPPPVASRVTRWMSEPFSLGSYSFAEVGSTDQAYDDVAAPVETLFFAGEHTSKHAHSTVHGAWETGRREARRLIQEQ